MSLMLVILSMFKLNQNDATDKKNELILLLHFIHCINDYYNF